MRRNAHREQQVAGWPVFAPRTALALQTNLLALAHADGNAHIDLTPVGEGDAPRAAARGFFEADRHRKRVILTPARAPPPPAAATAAENLAEDVLGAESALGGIRIAPVEVKIAGARPKATRARIETARIAVGVDHALIEFRALLLVAENVVGGADFLKALLRRRIAAVLVGMVLLGERAESLLDLGFARVLRNTQDFIRVTHACSRRPRFLS